MSEAEQPEATAVPETADDVMVLSVDAAEASPGIVVESLAPEDLRATLAELQTEFAGTDHTGVPAVDAALDRLADLDPNDLGASADVLADVLQRLEGVLGDPGRA